MLALLFVPAGYLLGSLPAGYFISRWRGVEIRDKGSRSPGATNVARILGLRYGILVALVDIGKSFLLITLVGWVTHSVWLQTAVLGAAMLGAVFPVFLRFKGGKGVAVLAGGAIALLPLPMILGFSLLWAGILLATRIMSLTNLVSAVIFMAILLLFADPLALKFLGIWTALFLAFSHRENIRRILKGKEPSLSFKL